MYRANLLRRAPSFRRIATSTLGLAALLWFSATSASAQFGGRGGDGREGGDRGRGFFNPAEMVDRMDENKNGQVDPEEMQGRSRFFLERIASDNNLDLSKPIPTAKLRDLMQARFQGGGSGSRGPGGSGGSGSSTPAPIPTKTPVVDKMAFGVDTSKQPKVPGFGTDLNADSWETIKAKYDQRIVERVEESLNRMDKNKDGILDAEEIKNGQWRGDPKDSDTNKDGKLTRSELAERQKLRDQNGGGGPGGSRGGFPGGGFPGGGFGGDGFNGGPGGGGPSRSSSTPPSSSSSSTSSISSSAPMSTPPVVARPTYVAATSAPAASPVSTSTSSSGGGASAQIAGYADGLLKQYDTNKDGTLQRDEWSQMNSKRQKADANGDGLITKDEIIAQLSDYAKSSGSSSSSSSGGSSSSSAGPNTTTYGGRAVSSRTGAPGTVKTYRFLTPIERLPKGLPDWFTRNDTNGDGQVAMKEFSTTWDDAKTAEFAKWDRNGDGFITPREATASQ